MSELNGDRARFQKNRVRKLLHRQRIHALAAGMQNRTPDLAGAARRPIAVSAVDATGAASLAMNDEGGAARTGD